MKNITISITIIAITLFFILLDYARNQDIKNFNKRNSMTYCERLNSDIENTHLLKRKNTLLLEKMVAIQSGECK